jgi:hypothetical protein
MKIMHLKMKLLLFFTAFCISVTNGQSYEFDEFNEINFFEGSYYLFTFKTGGSILRQFVGKGSDHLIIVHENNIITEINLYEVKKIRVVDRGYINEPNYWFPNLLSNQYINNNSAFTSGSLKGNIQNIYIFYLQATLGISKYIDLSAGFLLPNHLPSIGARIGNIKLSDNFYTGGTFYYLHDKTNPYVNRSILKSYGLITYGNRNNNLTLGVGVRKGDRAQRISRSFQLNGMVRITEKKCLIVENSFDWSVELTVGHGLMLRFFNLKWSLDLGVVRNLEFLDLDADGEVIPYWRINYAF